MRGIASGAERARRQIVRGLGFTIIEVMLAVLVAAILAVIAYSYYGDYKYQSEVAKATFDINSLEVRIEQYVTNNQTLPATLADIGITASQNVDPWGFPYQYINHSLLNGKGKVRRDRNLNPLNPDYDLYSVGKDGLSKMPITQAESQDDVIRAGGGTYVGLASLF